jgi:hypothetical protein
LLRRATPITRRDEAYFLLQRSYFRKTTFHLVAPGGSGKALLKKKFSQSELIRRVLMGKLPRSRKSALSAPTTSDALICSEEDPSVLAQTKWTLVPLPRLSGLHIQTP